MHWSRQKGEEVLASLASMVVTPLLLVLQLVGCTTIVPKFVILTTIIFFQILDFDDHFPTARPHQFRPEGGNKLSWSGLILLVYAYTSHKQLFDGFLHDTQHILFFGNRCM